VLIKEIRWSVPNVKFAENLFALCETHIAQNLVAMQQEKNQELHLFQEHMQEHERQIPKENLVLYAENSGNTDIMMITQNPNLLLGYVQVAIEDYTN
jgi:hypothetical protein